MYKIKTRRSLLKRFKVTGSGKLLRKKASHSHLLQKKATQHKQKLKKQCIVTAQDIMNIRNGLPYIY